MYTVLEHSFRQREGDEQRCYLELPPIIAPIKCSILPISSNERFDPIIKLVREQLAAHALSHKIDDASGTIGRRYARTDEIGIPFAITIDFESEAKPHTVTLRHSPSMQQVRMEVSNVGPTVSGLVDGTLDWKSVTEKFPIFQTN